MWCRNGWAYLNNSGTHSCDVTGSEYIPSFIWINELGNVNGSSIIDTTPTFNWTGNATVLYYNLVIANDSSFLDIYKNWTDINETNYGVYYIEKGNYVEFTVPASDELVLGTYYIRCRAFCVI